MSSRLLWGATILVVVSLVIVGCSQSTAPDDDGLSAAEKAEMTALLDADGFFTGDQTTLNDDGPVNFNVRSLGKTVTPIYPRGWGRRVTSLSRSITFQRSDDSTVVATIVYTATGQILIPAVYSILDTNVTLISKDFSSSFVRLVKFHLAGVRPTGQPVWFPREISASEGGTQTGQLTINQVEVTVGSSSLTVTDPPTAYFMRLPRFGGREVPECGTTEPITVKVTITSTESDTDFVSLRHPWRVMPGVWRPVHVRMRLTSQVQSGANYVRTYELSWSTHHAGRHHFFVEAVTRSSLFDDVAPWSTELWGIPYFVQ